MELLVPLFSLLVSFVLGAIVLALSKAPPLETYRALIHGAFGSRTKLQYTIVKALPLLMCGLAVGIAFRLKFWNIGAEGQYVMGVIGITWVIQFWNLPPTLMLPVGLAMSIVFGSIWGGIPGALKANWKVDETITTLMMNYIAIGIAEYLYINAWKAPKGNMGTIKFPEAAWLKGIWGRVHAGIIIALVLVVVLYFVLYKTKWGFELNMIGKNPTAARCQGVAIKRNIILAMLVSGAIAGLAGGIDTAGVTHCLTKGVDSGYGFTGIIVAWMSGLNPFISILVAMLLAALETGADALQISLHLPAAMGNVLEGLILIPLLAGNIFIDYRLKKIDTKEEKA
ncbi:MAG: ABC transporter permease [Spirochaetia bacterium]|jgi:simple sugar transport system permease protein|nr:ABC transporter permease [Spirochaetia bacterium]